MRTDGRDARVRVDRSAMRTAVDTIGTLVGDPDAGCRLRRVHQ
jgi:hypothetical protein